MLLNLILGRERKRKDNPGQADAGRTEPPGGRDPALQPGALRPGEPASRRPDRLLAHATAVHAATVPG